MKFIITAVRDKQINSYMRPFFAPSVGAAIRSFSDECKRQADDNMLAKHPSDFALYHLGNWDDETAALESFPSPTLLIEADQV